MLFFYINTGLVTVVFPCVPAPIQTPSDASGIFPWSPRYTRIFPVVPPVVTPVITLVFPRGNAPCSIHLPVEPLA